MPLADFLDSLIHFVETHVTQKIIDEDINHLLPPDRFKAIRKNIKRETLMLLRDERQRLVSNKGAEN